MSFGCKAHEQGISWIPRPVKHPGKTSRAGAAAPGQPRELLEEGPAQPRVGLGEHRAQGRGELKGQGHGAHRERGFLPCSLLTARIFYLREVTAKGRATIWGQIPQLHSGARNWNSHPLRATFEHPPKEKCSSQAPFLLGLLIYFICKWSRSPKLPVPNHSNISPLLFRSLQRTLAPVPHQSRRERSLSQHPEIQADPRGGRWVWLNPLRQKRFKLCPSVFQPSNLPPDSFAMKRGNWRKISNTSSLGVMFSGSHLAGFDEIYFENSSCSSLVGKGLLAGSVCSKCSSRSWEKKVKATKTSLQFNGAGCRQFSEYK